MKERLKNFKKGLILEVATLHFQKIGYAETKMNQVAKDVGVSIGTIYEFFGSKDGLFKACVFQIISDEHQNFITQSSELSDPLQKLHLSLTLKFRSIERYRSNIREMLHSNPWFLQQLSSSEAMEQVYLHRATILEELQSLKGELKGDPIQLSKTLCFMADSYLDRFIDGEKSVEESVDEILSIYSAGIFK